MAAAEAIMERPHSRRPIEVLVVDDSAVVRQMMTALLTRATDLSVTTASDPLIAMQKMARRAPDVILLDLEMPRMDGLTFLRKLMAEDPRPVVVCSNQVGPGTESALRALEQGAVDVVAKPQLGVRDFLRDSAITLIDAVRAASRARVRRRPASGPVPEGLPGLARVPRTSRAPAPPSRCVVAVGASTGGPEALRTFLRGLPADAPGVVIVQHMPEGFTGPFAARLNEVCAVEVREAATGDPVVAGTALVAPGNRHVVVRRRAAGYYVDVQDGPLVSRHRPSVDVLFRSVAQAAGPGGVGVIMTGMGDDGAQGLLEMRVAGAATFAQDEQSSVVFGMPREAISAGAVEEIVALPRLSERVLRRARRAQ